MDLIKQARAAAAEERAGAVECVERERKAQLRELREKLEFLQVTHLVIGNQLIGNQVTGDQALTGVLQAEGVAARP